MAVILNIETATEVCSIAISKQGHLLHTLTASGNFAHSSQLTVLIQQAFEALDWPLSRLDAVALSEGPGSYTALRVGSAVAKGICYALDIPLIAVDTLQSIAFASQIPNDNFDTLYCAMIDARRMEVYAAMYNKNAEQVMDMEALIIDDTSFQSYFQAGKTILFSGNGAAKTKTLITHPSAIFRTTICAASNLIPFATKAFAQRKFEDVAYFTPTYGKQPNITTPKKRLVF